MRRALGETTHYFLVRFNKVYNSIPAKLKPPLGLALLHYSNCFDAKLAYQLRERNSTNLEYMHKNEVGVGGNLLNKKAKMKAKKRGAKEEASSLENKLEVMVKKMEKLVEKLTLDKKGICRDQQAPPQIRNPNFKRLQVQIKKREKRNQGEQQQIRPPFQENYVEDEETTKDQDRIHFFGE